MSLRLEKILVRAEKALLISLALTLCICSWAQNRQSSLSGSIIRLHVLAASDDEYEQALKLRVRDAVLEYLSPALSDAASAADAQGLILSRLDGIAAAAYSAAEGRRVTVSLSPEVYPTRTYGHFTLPAGRYNSLRIVIGEGEGHNWWCIVFPQACLPAAEGSVMREALAPADYAVISGEDGYELRLRILELWGELTGKTN